MRKGPFFPLRAFFLSYVVFLFARRGLTYFLFSDDAAASLCFFISASLPAANPVGAPASATFPLDFPHHLRIFHT